MRAETQSLIEEIKQLLALLARDGRMSSAQMARIVGASERTVVNRVNKLIQSEVKKVNKTLANVERVKKFTILDKRLEEEDGEVTPTMKVKRKNISEMYGDVIEGMYKRM